MGIFVWGSILTLLLFMLILLLFYIYQQKQIREREKQINSLQQSLNDLQVKLKEMERRRAFRIKLPEQDCIFELIDFDDKLLERLKYKKGKGKIRDISLSGIKLECDYDLPVRKGIFLQLHFVLQDVEFSFKGKIVRKEELMKNIIYGIEFIDVNLKEQQRLYVVLQKISVENRKKTG
jgi:c-di-GMP-binding flagellar brake protein YcgR